MQLLEIVMKAEKNAGHAFQGDVMIARLPDGVHITSTDEIPLENGMLIVARGEATGHHHAIRYGLHGAANFRDDGLARALPAQARGEGRLGRQWDVFAPAANPSDPLVRVEPLPAHTRGEEFSPTWPAGLSALPRTRLYRDQAALDELCHRRFVTEPALCLGFLRVVEGSPALSHEEHAPITLDPGEYYVCGKREWTIGEARRVQD
jgi:hypothetical protein